MSQLDIHAEATTLWAVGESLAELIDEIMACPSASLCDHAEELRAMSEAWLLASNAFISACHGGDA